jgi:predicted DNA-binding protein
MSRKKVSTTIYITPEQADRLKLLHDRTKVPIAVYIREGIDMVLRHYEHVLPGQMTLEVTPTPPSVAPAPTPARNDGAASSARASARDETTTDDRPRRAP